MHTVVPSLKEQEAKLRASGTYDIGLMPQREKERQNQERSKGYVVQK